MYQFLVALRIQKMKIQTLIAALVISSVSALSIAQTEPVAPVAAPAAKASKATKKSTHKVNVKKHKAKAKHKKTAAMEVRNLP
jgi:ribosomal protein L12E/L44/L45/RPP1/RPP2